MPELQYLLVSLPGLLLGFTVHEFAHAWVALKQGDRTPYMMGRVTLDPRSHLDPVGSLLVPALGALFGGYMIGWARPVQTVPRNYRNYRRGDILVSLAGVTANLFLAFVFAIASAALMASGMEFGAGGLRGAPPFLQLCLQGVFLNCLLVVFNLMPVPGLDGGHVLYHFLPPRIGAAYREMERYGMMLLVGILLLGGFAFIAPLVNGLASLVLFLPLSVVA
jgi:Zn-dependent protease